MCAPPMYESEYMKGVTNVASMQEPVLLSQVNGMPALCFCHRYVLGNPLRGIVAERIVAQQLDIPALS